MTEQTRAEEMDAAFGEHMDAELGGDLDRTMATMTSNPHLVNVPTMIGGQAHRTVLSAGREVRDNLTYLRSRPARR